jgi:hypothetical protein
VAQAMSGEQTSAAVRAMKLAKGCNVAPKTPT